MTLSARLQDAVPSLTAAEAHLLSQAKEARRIAHTMPTYGAPESDPDRVYKAVRSSQRACAAASRYFALLRQCKSQGIAALIGED